MIMDAKLKSQKGQAVVEFLVFLPFILMMYSVTLSISNAINASINQQKFARSYFYFNAAGNSTLPYPRRDNPEPSDGWSLFGMQIMGWSTRLDGREPVAPCYKFNLPLGENEEDTCDEGYSAQSTNFIRVMTVYGVCGATYGKNGDYPVAFPRAGGGSNVIARCSIVQ